MAYPESLMGGSLKELIQDGGGPLPLLKILYLPRYWEDNLWAVVTHPISNPVHLFQIYS